MQIGLSMTLVSAIDSPAFLDALGPLAEDAGFAPLWFGEHAVLFDAYESRYPLAADGKIPGEAKDNVEFEPFTTLAYLAGQTSTIRLGAGVCILPQRNPVYTAKEAANVDWLSGGRLDFGIGAGWLAEEFAALGVSFEQRGARCDAYLDVVKRLWCDEISECHNAFYDLPPCRFYPKPVQHPHLPIIIGGNSDAALRRVANSAQGWYPIGLLPDVVAAGVARLDELLAERERNRSEITIYAAPYPHPCTFELVERYCDAGVDQVIILDYAMDVAALEDSLHRYAEEIVQPAESL